MTSYRVLAVVLAVSLLPPLAVGVLSVVDRDAVLAMFHVAATPDTRAMALYFGLAAFMCGGADLLAVVWLLRGRPEGATLGAVCGGLTAVAGAAMIALGPEPSFGAIDFAKGLVMLAGSVWVGARVPRPSLA